MTDEPIRDVPFELAEVIDRPGLRRLDEIEDEQRREALNARLASREAAAGLDSDVAAATLSAELASRIVEVLHRFYRAHPLGATVDEGQEREAIVADSEAFEQVAKVTARLIVHASTRAVGIDVPLDDVTLGRPLQRREFDVRKQGRYWVVEAKTTGARHRTKRDAVRAARTLARQSGAEMRVLDARGRVVEATSYESPQTV